MKITLLIPCYNEEQTITACIRAALDQTRRIDEIIVVNDGSTDNSRNVIEQFGGEVTIVDTPYNCGSKSKAQEYGVQFVTGDVLLMTDADTILSPEFAQRAESAFNNPDVHAFAGYIKSIKHNWLTACRELDYIIGQDLHKTAQSYLETVVIIPGCGAGFRMNTFRKYITFDHDTVTEDLDFTYKLHSHNLKIYFDHKAVVHTQDPATLDAYIKQMRRWIGGGWQNLLKHRRVIMNRHGQAIEASLSYVEGVAFGLLFFLLPLINVVYFLYFLMGYFVVAFLVSSYAAYRRKRTDLLYYAPLFPFVLILNSYIFFEQFVYRVIFQQRDLTWYKPTRRNLETV